MEVHISIIITNYPFVFQLCPFPAPTLSTCIHVTHLSVATISGTDAYSSAGIDAFQDAVLKVGVKVTGSQSIIPDSKNVSREVLNLVYGGTRIIVVFARPQDMGIVIREFNRHEGWKPGSGVVYLFSESIKVGCADP